MLTHAKTLGFSPFLILTNRVGGGVSPAVLPHHRKVEGKVEGDVACYFSIASEICSLTDLSAFKYFSPRFAARLTPDEPR